MNDAKVKTLTPTEIMLAAIDRSILIVRDVGVGAPLTARELSTCRDFIRETATILGDRCACGHFEVQHHHTLYAASGGMRRVRMGCTMIPGCPCARFAPAAASGAEGGGS